MEQRAWSKEHEAKSMEQRAWSRGQKKWFLIIPLISSSAHQLTSSPAHQLIKAWG